MAESAISSETSHRSKFDDRLWNIVPSAATFRLQSKERWLLTVARTTNQHELAVDLAPDPLRPVFDYIPRITKFFDSGGVLQRDLR
jgi:hypothetical protein